MVNYILLFSLTLLSSTMGNVKNILLIKGNKTTQYIITCIDALIYAFLLKSITSDNTIYAIIAFVCGKGFSITLTDIIMSKISKTVYLAHLYERKAETERKRSSFKGRKEGLQSKVKSLARKDRDGGENNSQRKV